jgi:hypothetical protein
MLHSDPGVGKSICAMDLAIRVGLGLTEWCVHKIKWRARVLYGNGKVKTYVAIGNDGKPTELGFAFDAGIAPGSARTAA